MDLKSLREKNIEELKNELLKELKDQFTMKLQGSTGGLKETHLFAKSRKQVARIKTILSERTGVETNV